MVQGSVGFHCPECVKAAPQRTMKLKARRLQPQALTSVVIVAVNVAVWLAVLLTGWGESRLIDVLALTPHGFCPTGDGYLVLTSPAGCAAEGLQWQAGVATGAFWQVLSSEFLHVQPWHILFNMMALFVLGPQVEALFGRARFLAMYLFSGLTASTLVMALAPGYQATLGASGAIFGLMGAFLVLALKRKADLRGILIWLGLNAAFTFMVPNVSWEGHLGGFLGGVAITALMAYLPRPRRKLEWPLAALLTVLVLAAIVGISIVRFG